MYIVHHSTRSCLVQSPYTWRNKTWSLSAGGAGWLRASWQPEIQWSVPAFQDIPFSCLTWSCTKAYAWPSNRVTSNQFAQLSPSSDQLEYIQYRLVSRFNGDTAISPPSLRLPRSGLLQQNCGCCQQCQGGCLGYDHCTSGRNEIIIGRVPALRKTNINNDRSCIDSCPRLCPRCAIGFAWSGMSTLLPCYMQTWKVPVNADGVTIKFVSAVAAPPVGFGSWIAS